MILLNLKRWVFSFFIIILFTAVVYVNDICNTGTNIQNKEEVARGFDFWEQSGETCEAQDFIASRARWGICLFDLLFLICFNWCVAPALLQVSDEQDSTIYFQNYCSEEKINYCIITGESGTPVIFQLH